MHSEYHLFQKFTDIETAHDFATELRAADIPYHLIDHSDATNVKVQGYNTIQVPIELNIREDDFAKAQQVLDNYYQQQIQNIDPSYYLFAFTNEELTEIIQKPYEWGRLDYYMARHLLKQKGITISEEEIVAIKAVRLEELKQVEPVSEFKKVAGYIFSVVFPPIGFGIGITIKHNRKLLPTGERFFIHSEEDRKQATYITNLSILFFVVYFLIFLYKLA